MELRNIFDGADGETWEQQLLSVIKLSLQKVCWKVEKEYLGVSFKQDNWCYLKFQLNFRIYVINYSPKAVSIDGWQKGIVRVGNSPLPCSSLYLLRSVSYRYAFY